MIIANIMIKKLDDPAEIAMTRFLCFDIWSAIAAKLPGRTDNEIKNVWHTNLKKKLKNYQLPQVSNEPSSAMIKTHSNESNLSPERSSSDLSSITLVKCFPQIDESFWSEHCPSEMSSSGMIESTAMNCSTNDQLVIRQDEMDSSKFIRQNKSSSQEQVSPLDESSMQLRVEGVISEPTFEFPSSRMDCGNEWSTKVGEDMEFWFNVFTRAEDLPDLPDF
ncbi:hypothetical protein LIER_33255 [Lithospermum erythrorhizon]|uniref:HTH myb-type domain-containing protein n=1 Tax=Lithospermum erythrorhizon TaxID=34254 RepID=A0AAV3S037_LITER